MSKTGSEIPSNEDIFSPPPLGLELTCGKWKVHVIDVDGKVTVDNISGKQVWRMQNRRVMVDFNRRGQPIKDSGGLLGTWPGSLCYDFNILPINYTDWRKVSCYRKDMAWKVVQNKFWFDDPSKRKKYVISTLGNICKDLKQHLWKDYKRNTLEESLEARPPLIPNDQWTGFVYHQFSDKAKKTRERNTNNRSKSNVPHALGKKSMARKAHEMEEATGVEPSRSEIFIASRTRSDGSMISEETVEKVKQVMKENIKEETPSSDAIAQIFGPEHFGRVRCVGCGPTPSKYFSSESDNVKIVGVMNQLEGLKEKVDIVANALQVLIESKEQMDTKNATFLANLKGYINEVVHASMNKEQMGTKNPPKPELSSNLNSSYKRKSDSINKVSETGESNLKLKKSSNKRQRKQC